MNVTLKNFSIKTLKELLYQCTDEQQLMFKRFYAKGDLTKTIDQVVETMDEEKYDHAIYQCERTIENNKSSLLPLLKV